MLFEPLLELALEVGQPQRQAEAASAEVVGKTLASRLPQWEELVSPVAAPGGLEAGLVWRGEQAAKEAAPDDRVAERVCPVAQLVWVVLVSLERPLSCLAL